MTRRELLVSFQLRLGAAGIAHRKVRYAASACTSSRNVSSSRLETKSRRMKAADEKLCFSNEKFVVKSRNRCGSLISLYRSASNKHTPILISSVFLSAWDGKSVRAVKSAGPARRRLAQAHDGGTMSQKQALVGARSILGHTHSEEAVFICSTHTTPKPQNDFLKNNQE